MEKKIRIQNKQISVTSPVFIIAEAGINHNGDLAIARQLIEQAKICGADCVKFQTFKAERVVTIDAPKAKYQLNTTDKTESQYQMLKKVELTKYHHEELIKMAEEMGLIFLSTPYNFEDVDFLEDLNVSAYKIASGQIIEHAFLKKIARTGKPIFLSTGMATMAEVKEALDVLTESGNEQIILLQCTTNYPSSFQDANLKVIPIYEKTLNCIPGYSDHTLGSEAVCAAVALGAKVIEKHFTIDKSLEGPDHLSSMVPAEFRELVKKIKCVESVLGDGFKKPTPIEEANKIGMRRSIVATTAIKNGQEITRDNISFKRPGTGLHPKLYEYLLGKKAITEIEKDTLIRKEMLNW